MRVFTYVIAYDSGSAPNYEPPSTTLAICKPKIRKVSGVGDLILAFQAGRLGPEPHGVRWAGIVSEKLTFAQYWSDSRFQQKKPARSANPDNIYKPVGGELQQVPNSVHDAGNVITDISGEYVLVLKKSWQFGSAAPVLPEVYGLRMASGRRSHRKHDVDKSTYEQLIAWLDARQREVKPGGPSESGPGCGKKRIQSDGCPPKPKQRSGARC